MKRFSSFGRVFIFWGIAVLLISVAVQLSGGWRGVIGGLHFSLQRPNPLMALTVVIFSVAAIFSTRVREDAREVVDWMISKRTSAIVFWIICVFMGCFILAMGAFHGNLSVFDLNREDGLGTYFHGFLLFIAGIFILSRTRTHSNKPLGWLAMAGIFWAMAIDELTSIHESIPRRLGIGTSTNEIFGLVSWTVLLAPVILAVMLYFVTVSLRLSRRSLALVIIGGVCYLSAIALEQLILGPHIQTVQCVAEEGMEILGTTMFIVAFGINHKVPDRSLRKRPILPD